MEPDQILDLSELCRLCLDSTHNLVSFDTKLNFTKQSIPDLIRFCLDVNCNIQDNGILPKYVCKGCLEKLEVSFELKSKSHESDKYLKEILVNQTSDVEAEEHVMTSYSPAAYYPPPDVEDESLLEPLESLVNDSCDTGTRKDWSEKCESKCPVCSKIFRYEKSFRNHLRSHGSLSLAIEREEQEQAVSFEDTESETESIDTDLISKGKRLGDYECPVCEKSFKYIKPYKNHLKLHQLGALTKSGNSRSIKKQLKRRLVQAPYDSLSPYGSPAPFKTATTREPSPDFGLMVVASNSLERVEGAAEPSSKKFRQRKQRLPSRSPSHEPSPELIEYAPKSRGRPKLQRISKSPSVDVSPGILEIAKRSRGRPRKHLKEVDERNQDEDKSMLLEGFSEVDVSRMLKTRTSILDDDSLSHSAPSSSRGQSRSASVEVVQEVDIFGSVLPVDILASPVKSGFGSGTTFPCDSVGCDKKFHLRANLKKHQRETHLKN